MLTLATASAMSISTLHAQQFTYPAKGQSPEQQKKDEAECGKWATGQTGYDPARPPPRCGRKCAARASKERDTRSSNDDQVARRVVVSSAIDPAIDASASASLP